MVFLVYANATHDNEDLIGSDGKSIKEKHGPFESQEEAERCATAISGALPRVYEFVEDGVVGDKYIIQWEITVIDPVEAEKKKSERLGRNQLTSQKRTSGSPVETIPETPK